MATGYGDSGGGFDVEYPELGTNKYRYNPVRPPEYPVKTDPMGFDGTGGPGPIPPGPPHTGPDPFTTPGWYNTNPGPPPAPTNDLYGEEWKRAQQGTQTFTPPPPTPQYADAAGQISHNPALSPMAQNMSRYQGHRTNPYEAPSAVAQQGVPQQDQGFTGGYGVSNQQQNSYSPPGKGGGFNSGPGKGGSGGSGKGGYF